MLVLIAVLQRLTYSASSNISPALHQSTLQGSSVYYAEVSIATHGRRPGSTVEIHLPFQGSQSRIASGCGIIVTGKISNSDLDKHPRLKQKGTEVLVAYWDRAYHLVAVSIGRSSALTTRMVNMVHSIACQARATSSNSMKNISGATFQATGGHFHLKSVSVYCILAAVVIDLLTRARTSEADYPWLGHALLPRSRTVHHDTQRAPDARVISRKAGNAGTKRLQHGHSPVLVYPSAILSAELIEM